MANISQKAIVNLPKELRTDIQGGLLRYGKVKVVGLGIFEIKKIKSRMGRNPASGEIVMMPAYSKVKFRPTASLKEQVA